MYSVLLWVRREAPIIIHVKLDSVLHHLVKDTHYRNQFETHTSGGCTDLRIRSSWEVAIYMYIHIIITRVGLIVKRCILVLLSFLAG